MRLKRFSMICVSVSIIAGCASTGQSDIQSAFDLNAQRIAECERKDFPTHRAKAECMNAADRALMPSVGADADLLRYRMAKRIEVADRIDKGQISVAKANTELTRVYSQVQSERNRRIAIRAQTVANVMQAQTQSNALTSMANSQARIANSLENQNRNISGQRDPYSWAGEYARRSQ